jgi:hypothetical protein
VAVAVTTARVVVSTRMMATKSQMEFHVLTSTTMPTRETSMLVQLVRGCCGCCVCGGGGAVWVLWHHMRGVRA